MASKTISLSLEAYNALKTQKKEGESFSDVILRLLAPKAKTSDFIGAWADNTPEEQKDIKRLIRSMRDEEGSSDESLLR
jgi:predicted CopG family antitoxin